MVQDIKIFRADERFLDFIDLWMVDEDCPFSRWCRNQGDISMKEARNNFLEFIREKPTAARFAHFHLGFIVHHWMREQWVIAASALPIQAFKMLETDVTLSQRHISFLTNSIKNSNAVEIINSLETLVLPERNFYNPESDLARKIVNENGYSS